MDQTKLQYLVEQLSIQYFNKKFNHKASFNLRLRTTGGRYLLGTHNIELNKKYLDEQGIEALIGIIKHELCHYHLHLEGKGYKHRDKAFKELLEKVDAPRFCTPLKNTAKSKVYKYFYQCKGCGLKYKRKRRMNLKRYVCGRCRGGLIDIS